MRSASWKRLRLISALVLAVALATGCGSAAPEGQAEPGQERHLSELAPVALEGGQKLRVVASTTIVGDVVSNVGDHLIELTTLMSPGVDPHSYIATPSDTAAFHDAHVVFANGAGLEVNLEETFVAAGGEAILLPLSEGLELRPPAQQMGLPHSDEGEDAGADEHTHGDVDPHVWFSVPNAIHWVGEIERILSILDPAHADAYASQAKAYGEELEALDAWVEEQVALIPESNRKLVTSHPVFGYLADRYGLEQLGAVYPVSPSSEPSAQDIAALEDAIRDFGVPAVFTESTVNPSLARQVAEDTGVKLVPLYTGSLSEPGGGAESYVDLVRFDVTAIVEALR